MPSIKSEFSLLPPGFSPDAEWTSFPGDFLDSLPDLPAGTRVELVEFHPLHSQKYCRMLKQLGCVADDLVLLPQVIVVDGDRVDQDPHDVIEDALWRYFTNQTIPGVIWCSSKATELTMARCNGRAVMIVPKPLRLPELLVAIHIAAQSQEAAFFPDRVIADVHLVSYSRLSAA